MMRRDFAQFAEIRAEQLAFRREMLSVLTPAHRELIAQIVGELVIDPTPDVDVATRRLNAALSPGEAQDVMRIENARQTATLRRFSRVAAEHGFPNPPMPAIAPNSGVIRGGASVALGADAGSILLRTAGMTLISPVIGVIRQATPAR